MQERIMRIIRLDKSVFKEIAADPNATQQALIIVLVVSVLAGLGSGIALFTAQTAVSVLAPTVRVGYGAGHFFLAFFSGIITGLIGWGVRSFLTQLVGSALFQGKSTFNQMLRVLGYAAAPQLLTFFAFIPCIGWIAAAVGGILSLIAALLAIQQVMEFDIVKAIVTAILAAVGAGIVAWLIGLIFAVPRAFYF